VPADVRTFAILFDQRYLLWDDSDLVSSNHAFDVAAFMRQTFDV
jgi:hypothetical protein